jgi:hypothetical protein
MFLLCITGHAVAQFVEALRYTPEDRGFDSRSRQWNFSVTKSFPPHCGSASNGKEYQEYFLAASG